jgi:diguanylate cyclase (GGDEF)-like protein
MVYILAAILLAIAVFHAVFAGFSFRHRESTQAALPLSLLLLTLAVYSGGYAGELLSRTLPGKLFWCAIQYLGISFLPTLWIVFTARYMNVQRLYRRLAVAVMLALSLSTLFGALTDGFLHLRYATVSLATDGPISVLSFARGPLYWTHTFYSLGAFLIGSIVLLNGLFTTPHFFRRRLILMLTGTTLPWINYLFYLAGINLGGVDTIPFSISVSALCFGLAVFRYRILDVVPVARSRVFETMSDGVIVLDSAGKIADYNEMAARIFPELRKGTISTEAIVTFREREALCMHLGMNVEADFSFSMDNGSAERHYNACVSFIRNGKGETIGRIINIRDSTETIRLMKRLTELATLDSLTGISNRRNFIDTAKRQIAQLSRGRRALSIAILDLDNFKRLNDTYGHLVGDEALRQVAKELTAQVRAGDAVARFGGEEFICLLSDAGASSAPAVVERMRAAIEGISIQVGDAPPARISASFGLTCVNEVLGNENLDSLLSQADLALYEAKAAGRNTVAVYREG